MHYLDNAATTRVHPQVADEVDRVLRGVWANPSSLYGPGADAEEGIHAARRVLLGALGCREPLDLKRPQLVFTASGTEADNIAVFGAARPRKSWGDQIVATGYEHPAVRRPLGRLAEEGFRVTFVAPGPDGRVDAAALLDAVGPKTVLVCAMQMNNETGAVLDVTALAAAVKQKNRRTAVHVDAVQAFTKLPLDVGGAPIDTVALSGHKLHAPKGVGALYVRRGFSLLPPFAGGGQEGGIRPGTQNTAFIAGFAKAVQLALDAREQAAQTVQTLHDRLVAGLAGMEGIESNSPPDAYAGILNFSLPGVRSEVMLHHLAAAGVYVSGGAACNKGERSHTLEAMGLPDARINCALRVSLCGGNTVEDIDALLCGLRGGLATLAR